MRAPATTLNHDRYDFCMNAVCNNSIQPLHRQFVTIQLGNTPKPSPTAPPDCAHKKQQLLHSCESLPSIPHVKRICPTRMIQFIRGGAPLPGHCPIPGFPLYAPPGTTAPYHLALNDRIRKLHIPKRCFDTHLIHLTSGSLPTHRLPPYRSPCRIPALDLLGVSSPGRTHLTASLRPHQRVLPVRRPAPRRQYSLEDLLASGNSTHPTLWRPVDHARALPLPRGIFPAAPPAFMTSHSSSLRHLANDAHISPIYQRPCTQKVLLRLLRRPGTPPHGCDQGQTFYCLLPLCVCHRVSVSVDPKNHHRPRHDARLHQC